MSRLDDIKARAEAPDYDAQLLRRWVDTHSGTMSLHEARVESVLDDLAHARTDIPDLLRVVEAARELMAQSCDPDVPCGRRWCDALRAALADLDR